MICKSAIAEAKPATYYPLQSRGEQVVHNSPSWLKLKCSIEAEVQRVTAFVRKTLNANQEKPRQSSLDCFAAPYFRCLKRVRKAIDPVNSKHRLVINLEIAPVLENWNE